MQAETGGKLNTLQRIRRIETAIEAIRPNLQRDHGDIELVDIDGKNVYVNMTGACSGCQMASTTLDGVQRVLTIENPANENPLAAVFALNVQFVIIGCPPL